MARFLLAEKMPNPLSPPPPPCSFISTTMSSARFLALEEFTSFTSPLPSILLPRSEALRLVELCELAEMMPSTNVLDFGRNQNNDDGAGSSDDNNDGIGSRNPHVLVTQMALLLYLGEYIHVRHLWRRNRGGRVTESIRNNSDDYAQLELLWKAAKYCCLWSTGGIYTLTSSSSSDSPIDLVSSPSSSDNGVMMQVESTNSESGIGSEEEDGEGGSSSTPALPFSTIALRALQSCGSKKMEPLSTYSAELLVVFRSRVNRGLHRFFDKLDCGEFCLRMNLESPSAGKRDRDKVWNTYGWTEEGGYLVLDVDNVAMDDDDSDEGEHEGGTLGKEGGRIEKLTEIIMFLEGKMNA